MKASAATDSKHAKVAENEAKIAEEKPAQIQNEQTSAESDRKLSKGATELIHYLGLFVIQKSTREFVSIRVDSRKNSLCLIQKGEVKDTN